MVASSGLIEVIAERLQHYGAKNIVVDPVMVATSGARLISEDAIATLEARLLPLATVLTPNIPEAEVLSGLSITSPDDMIAAGKVISERYGCAVLCKGGHRLNDANDLLYRDGGYAWFNGKRIDNPNTHGTGCTLSSTIAANLAKGYDLDTAVQPREGVSLRRAGRHARPRRGLRPDGPCVRPEAGIPSGGRKMKKTSSFQNGLIWFGAAVSIAEILTGTYFRAPRLHQGSDRHPRSATSSAARCFSSRASSAAAPASAPWARSS